MAAGLRVQHGPGWIGTVLTSMGISGQLQLLDQFTNRRKRKHIQDAAKKSPKKQRLETRYSASVVNSPDSSYGSLPAEPDIPEDDVENALRESRSLSSK